MIVCPKCNTSYYMVSYSTTTAMAVYTIVKDGKVYTHNPNKTTNHCICLSCGSSFCYTEGDEEAKLVVKE